MSTYEPQYCPRHKIVQPPRGCPRCLLEEELEAQHAHDEAQRKTLTKIAIAGAVLLALGLWWASRPEPSLDVRMDPARCREPLVSAETALFAVDADNVAAGAAFLEVASTMKERAENDLQKNASGEVEKFARSLWDTDRDLARARYEWQGLRARYFHKADWLQTPSEELREVDRAANNVSTGAIPADQHRYAEALNGMRLAIQEAASSTSAATDENGVVDHERIQAAQEALQRDLERVQSNFPYKRFGEDPWAKAYFCLADAMRSASSVKLSARRAGFGFAERKLTEAETHINTALSRM